MIKKNIQHILIGSMLCMSTVGCSDSFFDTGNSSVVTPDDIEEIEKNDPEALVKIVQPMLLGMYTYMTSLQNGHGDFGHMSYVHLSDMMSDEIAMHTAGSGWFTFDYGLDYWGAQYTRPYYYWNFYFSMINNANELINKISLSTDNKELQAILGQAYALRGFSYFMLMQMYQQTYVGNESAKGCPIYITLQEGESIPSRAPLSAVMSRIESDFETSLRYLEGWSRPSKIHVNYDVAAGLYARVCLVKNDWGKAIEYSRIARRNTPIYTSEELKSEGFNNINSKEWMWGADITAETTTIFASFFSFICSYDAGYGGAVGAYRKIDAKLFDTMSESDVRRSQFKDPNGSYSGEELVFPNYTNLKFKKVSNWEADYLYMRSSEMLLIEAEALAHQGNNAEAATVLGELMRHRDASWSQSSVSAEAVYGQRRLELWGEGFGLWDKLRLGKGIERNYSGSNHLGQYKFNVVPKSWFMHYQIPLSEIDNNQYINSGDQNPSPYQSDKQY